MKSPKASIAESSASQPTNLLAVQPGPTAKVVIQRLVGNALIVSRLRELGFIQGELVQVVGRAPFGEPILIEIRGTVVALRKSEAQCVQL